MFSGFFLVLGVNSLCSTSLILLFRLLFNPFVCLFNFFVSLSRQLSLCIRPSSHTFILNVSIKRLPDLDYSCPHTILIVLCLLFLVCAFSKNSWATLFNLRIFCLTCSSPLFCFPISCFSFSTFSFSLLLCFFSSPTSFSRCWCKNVLWLTLSWINLLSLAISFFSPCSAG